MKKLVFYLYASFAFLFFFSSCEKQLVDNKELVSQIERSSLSEYKNRISGMGFDTTRMLEFDDYFLVEGDIRLEKASLVPGTKALAYSITVALQHQNPITVGIDPAVNKSKWEAVIKDAISEWTNITIASFNGPPTSRNHLASNIVMKFTNDPNPDILITAHHPYLPTPPGVLAEAGFPLLYGNGKPGNYVKIYPRFEYNGVLLDDLSYSQKKMLIVHELGHCLGWRHANYWLIGETLDYIPPYINGSQPHDKSVMDGANGCAPWEGFYYYDKLGMEEFYPLYARDQRIYQFGEVFVNEAREFMHDYFTKKNVLQTRWSGTNFEVLTTPSEGRVRGRFSQRGEQTITAELLFNDCDYTFPCVFNVFVYNSTPTSVSPQITGANTVYNYDEITLTAIFGPDYFLEWKIPEEFEPTMDIDPKNQTITFAAWKDGDVPSTFPVYCRAWYGTAENCRTPWQQFMVTILD